MRRTLAVVLCVALIALAGCSGDGPGASDDAIDRSDSETATVNFWVSDQPGALAEFETLNVTVTRVGFKPANGTNGSANDSEWVERDVNETTVDLTRLAGDNASLLDSVEIPNGTYTKTFMYVSEVEGTTTDGDRPEVKLPSEKLQLNTEFTAAANESVDFVFDIQVTRAGNSGQYIIRPVISESGTDQPIRDVNAEGEDESEDGQGGGQPDGSGNGNADGGY